MPKYNQEQLKDMAQKVLQAKSSGDMRFHIFMAMIGMNTGMTHAEIEQRIREFAQWEPQSTT